METPPFLPSRQTYPVPFLPNFVLCLAKWSVVGRVYNNDRLLVWVGLGFLGVGCLRDCGELTLGYGLL